MNGPPKTRHSPGTVYLVGAGPGDPGLLTLRAAELLRRARVVIYDGLVNPELLRLAPPTAEIHYGGKHDRTRAVSQDELHHWMIARARAGLDVIRLKGGDPFIFGRGGEEAEHLAAAGIPFEIVPGVSSVQSVPAYAGIPLTHREHTSCLTLVTGHHDPDSPASHLDWSQLAKLSGTLVVLMGLKQLARITAALIAHGRSPGTPAAVISHGTTSHQQTVTGTLETVADLVDAARLRPPATIVIGDVVRLRPQLQWFENRPLLGRRVVVTQRHDLAQSLVARLREHGADVLEIPATSLVSPRDWQFVDAAIARRHDYDWLLFSHPRAIDVFLGRFLELHGDLRTLGPARLGAYGPQTARHLGRFHLQPTAIADDHKTPLILQALENATRIAGERFLILRGHPATEPVPELLAAREAQVDVVTCYTSEPETADASGHARQLREQGADWLIFASGLAIEHFQMRFDLHQLQRRSPGLRIALASPTVRWALDDLGLAPAAIAKPNDVADLVRAILEAELRAATRSAA